MAAQTLDAIAPEAIAAALIEARGSIVKAAKALGVNAVELRRLCLAEPSLIEAALEAHELALDRAEAELLSAMREGELSTRLQAAAYIVRRSGR